MSDKSKEIDPIEIEINLIHELVGENIIIVVHKNGMSIMMDESIEDRPDEKLAMFSRMYIASRPSLILRLVLNVEMFFLLLAENIQYYFEKWFKKDK